VRLFRRGDLRIHVCITARACFIVSYHVGCVHRLRLRHGREFAIGSRVLPEPQRDWKRIDVEFPPPCSLITRAMKFAVMNSANGDGEFVAHSASQGTRLCKGEVVRIRWHAAAHKAGLPQNELSVVLIAQANRLAQSTDRVTARLLVNPHRSFVVKTRVPPGDGYPASARDSMTRPGAGKTIRRPSEGRGLRPPATVLAIADCGKPSLKPLLDDSGIRRCQGILGRQIPMRPGRRLVRRVYSRHLRNQAFPKACR
jgi:hypothetical protein